jgi:hypothetical protein
MNKNLIIVGGILTVVAVIGFSIIGVNNSSVKVEESIIAKHQSVEQVFAQFGQKVKEVAQVPSMQAEDVGKVFRDAMEGRYGADGSGAMFQWIQEQNPNLNSEVYTRIQTVIEAGRNDFQRENQQLIDLRRNYATALRVFPGGFLRKSILGYPTFDMETQYRPVSTASARETIERGFEEGPIQLR